MSDVTKQVPKDTAEAVETPSTPATVVEKNIFDDASSTPLTMDAMLAAGVHFGHPKSRRNPKMNDFIFTTRNNVNIIDLSKTLPFFKTALEFMLEVQGSGKQILFVGTKKQAQRFVRDIAIHTDNPYVIERWLGGTLTNYGSIRKRVKYMTQLSAQFEKDELDKFTKLERLKKQEELEKLLRRMGGIESMAALPGAVFVTDVKADHLAVKEAMQLGIPVIGLSDTNANPESVDYPIPANDDALSSLSYLFSHVAQTLKSGSLK